MRQGGLEACQTQEVAQASMTEVEDEGAVWAHGAMPGWWAAFKRAEAGCRVPTVHSTTVAAFPVINGLPSLSPHGFDSVA